MWREKTAAEDEHEVQAGRNVQVRNTKVYVARVQTTL